jgi:hypothetical protein
MGASHVVFVPGNHAAADTSVAALAVSCLERCLGLHFHESLQRVPQRLADEICICPFSASSDNAVVVSIIGVPQSGFVKVFVNPPLLQESQ